MERMKESEMMRLARGMEVGARSLERIVYITHAGQQITDGDAQLSDLGVCAETTVTLGLDACKAKGIIPEDSVGMTVYVQSSTSGQTVAVDVGVETTVSDLAAVAFQRLTTMGAKVSQGRVKGSPDDDFRQSGPNLVGTRYVCQKYEHGDDGLSEAHMRRLGAARTDSLGDGLMILQTHRANIVYLYSDIDGGPGNANVRAFKLRTSLCEQGL